MRKNFNRHPVLSEKIFFRKEKKIVIVNRAALHKKYGINGIILMLKQDFKLIKKNIKRFIHFNIQNSVHTPGKKYLIIRLYKRGYFNGVSSKRPILDSENVILAKCLSSENNIEYKNIKRKVFKRSLSNTKNVNALKKTILRRYKKTLAHLSDNEKLSLGVATTDLKIIKRF